MSERHLEELTLNGFKQDLVLYAREAWRKDKQENNESDSLWDRSPPPVTQLSFFSSEHRDESEANTDATYYWIYKPVRIELRDQDWAYINRN